MSKKSTVKPLAAAIGTAFVTSLAAVPMAHAADNPFGMSELQSGYMVADKGAEGKCGGTTKSAEGQCGGAKKTEEGKCGEGKCGGAKKAEEGKCGTETMGKGQEGKCGEGKCGAGN